MAQLDHAKVRGFVNLLATECAFRSILLCFPWAISSVSYICSGPLEDLVHTGMDWIPQQTRPLRD